MTQLTIDTNDSPTILRACRNMLTELLGESNCVGTMPPKVMSDRHKTETLADGDDSGTDDDNVVEIGSRGKAAGADAGSDIDTRKDTLGVRFHPEFCGEATEPFYTSGKRAGQWKKKRGVTEADYDAWYADQVELCAVTANFTATGEDEQVDTAGAFGGGGADQAGHGEPAGDPAPEDCGAFMGWVSAKQAAGLLTQEDIGKAYATAGVQVTDLFPPNDETTVAGNVASLYQLLVVKAGA